MTTLMLAYLCVSAYAAIGLIGIEAWDYRRQGDAYEPMTLIHLFQGAALSFVPLINIVACIGVTVYFFGEIAPKVVLFRKKK